MQNPCATKAHESYTAPAYFSSILKYPWWPCAASLDQPRADSTHDTTKKSSGKKSFNATARDNCWEQILDNLARFEARDAVYSEVVGLENP